MDQASPSSSTNPAQPDLPPLLTDAVPVLPASRHRHTEQITQRPHNDPELDATVSETSLPFEPAPQESLRLVANPFLAMSGLLLWFAVMQLILSGAAGPFTILAVLLALASLALLPALLHYHCLDCGRTGPLLTWKRHLCPRVVARRFEGRSRRLRGPTPTVQVVLWLWIYVQFLWIWHQASRGN